MNDDDMERRLRRAFSAKAEEAVDPESPLPAMSTPNDLGRARLRTAPLLAAAVVVTVTVAGSAALVQLSGHVTPHHLNSQSTPPVVTGGPVRDLTGSPGPTRPLDSPTGSGSTTSAPTATRPRITVPSSGSSRSVVPPPPVPPQRTGVPSGHPPTPIPPRGTGHHPTSPGSSAPTSTGAPSSTRPRKPTAPPTSSATPSGGPVGPCTSASLSLAVGGDRLVGANGDYTFLELTNSGPTCSLVGYPVVWVDDPADGVVAGPAAHRATPAPQQIVLATGKAAEFELYDTMSSAPSCTANYGTGRTLRMYPPGQSTPITIDYGYSACGLSVSSLHTPQPHPPTE